jgi:hypothetical protein
MQFVVAPSFVRMEMLILLPDDKIAHQFYLFFVCRRFIMTRSCCIKVSYAGSGASNTMDSLSSKATQFVAGVMKINEMTLTLKALHLCVGYVSA